MVDIVGMGVPIIFHGKHFVLKSLETFTKLFTASVMSQCEAQVKSHSHEAICQGRKIGFQLLILDNSVFLWIGSAPASLKYLEVAFQTAYVRI